MTGRHRVSVWVVLTIVALGLGTRALAIRPGPQISRIDELEYVSDGLLVLEGVTPGFKFAPGAVTTWAAFAYAAWDTTTRFVRPSPTNGPLPLAARLLVALDESLFATYADMSSIRGWVLAVVLAISLLGIGGLGWIGHRSAGWPGALLGSGLFALTPLVVRYSVEARPYAAAWSFAALAIAFAGSDRSYWRVTGGGVVYGLAVASRIEILLVAPLLVWELWRSSARAMSFRRDIAKGALVFAVTFACAAPWYIPHVLGNVRKLVTVGLAESVGLEGSNVAGPTLLFDLLYAQRLAPVVVLVLGGALVARRRDPRAWMAPYLAILLLSALVRSGGGLRHHFDLVLVTMVLGVHALGLIRERWPGKVGRRACVLATIVALVPLGVQTLAFISVERATWVEHAAIDWVERKVPEGWPVYVSSGNVAVPLPDSTSATAIWSEVAGVDAWREKLVERLRGVGLQLDPLPRALGLEHMYQERGSRRRFYILGGGHDPERHRYALRLIPNSDVEDPVYRQRMREFLDEGGLFWHSGVPLADLGSSVRAWVAADGRHGVYLYVRTPRSRATDRGVGESANEGP